MVFLYPFTPNNVLLTDMGGGGGWGVGVGGKDSTKTILPKSLRNNKLWVIQRGRWWERGGVGLWVVYLVESEERTPENVASFAHSQVYSSLCFSTNRM